MEIKGNIYKGQTEKVINVTNVYREHEQDIVAFAMAAAGETEASIWGHDLRWTQDMSGDVVQDVATVSLWLD
jgi:hypothetical protein